ncbi:MAG: excinuclease ABC subunit UvrA [Candidatus Omnitrophica bacterium]|nr:excinuclease ABC subunit UvrA [Candidatus Omnitrophota bacterium]
MAKEYIVIRGAKEHNLKNISLKIPRNNLVVITGLSGSGKSSLAFDTIYAEGQRRYVESLTAYARQFLEQLQKPDVELIEGISPAISIEQRTAGGNPRSTVGTQTEIYDYLRLLFARIGKVHCYKCTRAISRQSPEHIVQQVLKLPRDTKIQILSPLVRGRKGEFKQVFQDVRKQGFVRVRVDNNFYDIDSKIDIDKKKTHNIEAVVDRLTVSAQQKSRLTDSIETALKTGKGIVVVSRETKPNRYEDLLFSEHYACIHCGISFAELQPRDFSFNSPYGACPACNGLGTRIEVDPDLVIPDKNKTLAQGALEPWRRGGRGYILYYRGLIRELARMHGFSMHAPFKKLSRKSRNIILYGSDDEVWGKPFEGVIPHLERLFHETESDYLKSEINKYMSVQNCHICDGARLKKESLAVTIEGKSIWDIVQMSICQANDFFENLRLGADEEIIAYQALKGIRERFRFMINVGLDYLTLDRRSSTLSGGEAQRIRLATQVGAGLVGVVYILDEPSIGLHQRDNKKLLNTLLALRDLGNTLIVVEHDESTIRLADYIIDLGPGAGRHGGRVMVAGDLKELLKSNTSLTAKYLRGNMKIEVPQKRRTAKGQYLKIIGAREHNLKNIDVSIPLGMFVCVTGVSGSGKSTLVDEILYRALAQKFYRHREKPGSHEGISGSEFIDKVIVVDQSPIGRTPRSNPATYTGIFGPIRELFSRLPESRMAGYKPGRFSFNVKGGRCEDCQGDGIKKIEMHFLPDVYVTCQTCKGARFNEQTLNIKYKGKTIAEVLNMTVEEALVLFKNIPRIRDKLSTLNDVGLGYIQLGQSATTLSGGEAQRVKLSSELGKRSTGRTLYILDEPTTGLHFADIERLLKVLQKLVSMGNTVLVIEHNLEVIKSADHIIDLGPEGGDGGGKVVACGPPEKIANNRSSYTGKYLKKSIKNVKI